MERNIKIAIKISSKGLTTEINKYMPGTVLGVCDTPGTKGKRRTNITVLKGLLFWWEDTGLSEVLLRAISVKEQGK